MLLSPMCCFVCINWFLSFNILSDHAFLGIICAVYCRIIIHFFTESSVFCFYCRNTRRGSQLTCQMGKLCLLRSFSPMQVFLASTKTNKLEGLCWNILWYFDVEFLGNQSQQYDHRSFVYITIGGFIGIVLQQFTGQSLSLSSYNVSSVI
jgi:hypothetical protein